ERSPHIGGMDATAKAVASYEKALAIRRALFQSNPSDPRLRHDLLESLWRLAGAKQMQRRFDDAIALNRERLRMVAAAPDSGRQPELQYILGTTYATLADIYRQKGDLEQALVNARRSLEIRQALLDADPQSGRARRVVGISHEYLGYVLSDRHEYSEAAEEHRRALADFQPLAAAAPDNVDLQRNLEVAEGNLCESLTRVGQVSNAKEHCRLNVAVAEAMVRADPDNAQAVEDLGAAYATMGFALHTANQPSKALEFERRGEAQYRLAAARDPDSLAAATAHIDSLLEVARIEAVLN